MSNFSPTSVSLLDWGEMSKPEHLVQFYETDLFLLDSLSGFIGAGLSKGDTCIVVASQTHREALNERLQSYGINVAAASMHGQYISLDADEALSRFMVDGSPDPDRFTDIFAGIIAKASQGGRRVRVFGEMVALLWAEGNQDAAIRLEELWNDLSSSHSFSLLCAYPMNSFGAESLADPLRRVCASHSRLIPAESYSALADSQDQLCEIILLQQKAGLLKSEKDERRCAEDVSLHLASIIESSDDAIISKTLESVILTWNKGAERIFGYTAEETIGKTIYMLIPPDRSDEEGIILDKLKRGERIDHYETVRVAKDGQMVDVSLTVSPIKDRSGRIIAASKIARDISERKQAEAEREQLLAREQAARAEAETANRAKDEFLAVLSHELRTPLNVILGWARMLRTTRFDESLAIRVIEAIERNAKLQSQLVEDLLDISRIITGKLRLDLRTVEVMEVIIAAVGLIKPAAAEKGITLHTEIDPAGGQILGDTSRLQQIILNLLSNAVKFTPAGGRVEVQLEQAGSNIEIRVSDTGRGIMPDFLPFVFDRFRQADSTLTRTQGGLGLGLAIARHLVELHGGTLQAHSEGEGRGATFTIKLPVYVRQEAEQSSGIPLERDNANPYSIALKNLRVLVVEDNDDTREMLRIIIEQHGAQVKAVRLASEALDLIEKLKPNVLISDIEMPGEDGYSLIQKVRAKEGDHKERVFAIALTAHARTEDRQRAIEAGYEMHIAKPFDPTRLIKIIGDFASKDEGTE